MKNTFATKFKEILQVDHKKMTDIFYDYPILSDDHYTFILVTSDVLVEAKYSKMLTGSFPKCEIITGYPGLWCLHHALGLKNPHKVILVFDDNPDEHDFRSKANDKNFYEGIPEELSIYAGNHNLDDTEIILMPNCRLSFPTNELHSKTGVVTIRQI